MEFAIEILEKTKDQLERTIKEENLLRVNMLQARVLLNKIKQLKQGIKRLKAKQI
ncbi:hypothetical protein [Mucilaginibacter lappiensis]|uniref:Uncharacterized protein n=1 Tax=Mucilaginibacter lappiensis TaxID=354630 RepID=A0A841J9K2_9SPHI|nr:hypothetical protein [Mucilaginibacter lappiensis]MBB6127497.1 hypothetical protein [Mucilaginibacter lappiensis]